MKHLWPLLLLAGAFFVWNNKSCTLPVQQAATPPAPSQVGESVVGGPVRQWEHEVTDMPARERALPSGGLDARAMLDGARQGVAKTQ